MVKATTHTRPVLPTTRGTRVFCTAVPSRPRATERTHRLLPRTGADADLGSLGRPGAGGHAGEALGGREHLLERRPDGGPRRGQRPGQPGRRPESPPAAAVDLPPLGHPAHGSTCRLRRLPVHVL